MTANAVRVRTSQGWQDIAIQGPIGAQGPQGNAGTPGEKWFTGSGAPPGATGIVGDWYLDSASGAYYEKTGASAWTQRGSLLGPQGPAGTAGTAGAAGSKWYTGAGAPATGAGIVGDFYLNSTNGDYYEKTGAATWTLRGNLRGPQGATGSTGSQGPQGIQGPAGPSGASTFVSGSGEPHPNLCTNPGFETDNSGWDTSASWFLNAGATLAPTRDRSYEGQQALRVISPGSAASQGVRYIALPVTAGKTYSITVAVLLESGSGGMALSAGAGGVGTAQQVFTATGAWQLVTLTYAPTGSGSAQVAISVNAVAAATFLLDAVRIREQGVTTPGVDGALYLDTASLEFWGPKAAGAWPTQPFGRVMPLTPSYAQLKAG